MFASAIVYDLDGDTERHQSDKRDAPVVKESAYRVLGNEVQHEKSEDRDVYWLSNGIAEACDWLHLHRESL
jgi:hypothetical protein